MPGEPWLEGIQVLGVVGLAAYFDDIHLTPLFDIIGSYWPRRKIRKEETLFATVRRNL